MNSVGGDLLDSTVRCHGRGYHGACSASCRDQ